MDIRGHDKKYRNASHEGSGPTHFFPLLADVTHLIYRDKTPNAIAVDSTGLAPVHMSTCVKFERSRRDVMGKTCPVDLEPTNSIFMIPTNSIFVILKS